MKDPYDELYKDTSKFHALDKSKVRQTFGSPARPALYFSGPNADAMVDYDRPWTQVKQIYDDNRLGVDRSSVEYDCRTYCIRRHQDPDRQFTKKYSINNTNVSLFHHLQRQICQSTDDYSEITVTAPLWYFVMIEQYDTVVTMTDILYNNR